jgi:hypothetical protein
VRVLLDDDRRQALRRAPRGGWRAAVPHDDRRQAFERLVQQQQRGLSTSARPKASICCSPPESCSAQVAPALGQAREQLEHTLPVQGPGRATR